MAKQHTQPYTFEGGSVTVGDFYAAMVAIGRAQRARGMSGMQQSAASALPEAVRKSVVGEDMRQYQAPIDRNNKAPTGLLPIYIVEGREMDPYRD